MNSRDARTDMILNKYGLCSYVPPEIHHYQFKKIKFVRPERHVSSYVRRAGSYDVEPVSVSRKERASYVGFGPVGSHQSGIYETRSRYGSGGYSSSSSYIPTRTRNYAAELSAETPDYRTRYSGGAVHSTYSYSHAPRDYDVDKWYMKKSRSEYVYSPGGTDSGSTLYMGRYNYLLPAGYDSHKDYREHLRLRERLLLGERVSEQDFRVRLEYLQGVDSQGYSYHHGNLREPRCGGGIDCKCVGAAHYDTYAYRICPWGAECYGVRYTRSSVSETGHVIAESRYSADIAGSRGTYIGGSTSANFPTRISSGYQYRSGYGTDSDSGFNSSGSTTTYQRKSSFSNLYGEPKYAHGYSSAADRYGVGVGVDSTGGSYDRARPEGHTAGPGGVTNIKSTTEHTTYGTTSTSRDYTPSSYSPRSYSPSKYSSTYTSSSYNTSSRPTAHSPSKYDSEPYKYDSKPRDYDSDYKPRDYTPSSYEPSKRDYSPSSYEPSKRDYSPSSYEPSKRDYSPSSYEPSKRDYSPSSYDTSRPEGSPSAPSDDKPAGEKPVDSAPQKSGAAPLGAPSGDLSQPISLEGEDIPLDDDLGDLSVEADKAKPVEKSYDQPKPTTLDGEDVPADNDMGDIPSVEEDLKKPAHKSAPGVEGEDVPMDDAPGDLPSVEENLKKPAHKSAPTLEGEDVPIDENGLPSVEADQMKPVEKSYKQPKTPGDGLESADLPSEEVPMDDMSGIPSIDQENKALVKDAAPASKPKDSTTDKPSLLDSEDLPMEEVPMDDGSGIPDIDAEKKKQVKDAAPVATKPVEEAKPKEDPKAAKDAQKKAEEDAIKKAEEDAKKKAEEDAKKKAEEDAKKKAEEDAKKKAEEDAKKKAEEDAKKKAKEDAKKKAEEDAKKKADEEAKKKAEKEKKIADAKKKLEEKKKAEADRKKAEEDAKKKKAEEDAKKKADEAAKKKADEDAKKKAEEDAKKKAEEDAKKKAEEDAKKKKADEDAKKKAEEDAKKKKADEDAKKKANEDAKKKPEEKKPEEKKPEEKKPEEKKPEGLTGKEKLLTDLPEDMMQAIMRCIEGGEMDFPGLELDISVTEAIKRNVAKLNLDDEQNIIINFFSSPSSKEPTSLKLNIKGEKCKVDVTNPRDGRVKLNKIDTDENGKPSKIHVQFTPMGKRVPLNFVFSIKDGVMSMTESDLDPDNIYIYLTDSDPIRKKLNPSEKRAKEAIISINLQDGKTHDVKLKYGKGDCVAEVPNEKDTDCKVTKVVKDKKGDPELVTIAVTPKGCDKPMYLTFKIGDGVIDLVNIEYGGQPMPLKRNKDGSLQLTIPGLTPERIVELNMKLGPKDTDTSKVTLNFPDGKTCTATSDDKSTVKLVDFKYDDKGLPLSAVIDVTPKGKDKPMKFNVLFKNGVPTVSMVPGEEPEDEGQELIVRFKLSPDDKEPCEVKMVIKDGKLTATGDRKADVKVVSSKFDGKGEPTEIKLELIPKGAKGKPSLFFTCTIKDGDLKVSQDAPAKPAAAAPAEPAEPTEQELVVRFKLDPNKDPCVVKIGILGDECAAIGDKQASADVVDFKCSPNGDPEYIRLRLDPSDGSEGIFFVLRFVDGKLSVEQEDLPPEADLGNMGLQHSSAEQSMVVRFKLSPDDPNPCEVVLRMTPENCTASSDGKANVNVIEYVCNNDGDPELIKLQLTPQGSTESLYFILRFIDGQVNVESVDAPADARKKLNAKDFPAKLLSLKMLLKETDKVPVELNLKCQGPLVSAAEPSDVYRVLSTEPNKKGIAEVINVQVTHPKTGEIYLLRMKMVGDQVSIEGVEMFDLDKIDQYLKICFPNNASKIREIKKELAKTDKKDVLKVVLQHGARGTAVTTGNVTFDIGPMKEILRKINVASSFDDNDGYTMETFGDDEGYTLEESKPDSGMLLPEGVSQEDVTVGPDGMFQLILSDVQWKAMQSSQALRGINVNVKRGPGGRYIIVMDSTQWQQLQVNMKVIYTETIMQQINVQAQPGGGYMLILKPNQYDILINIGAFRGLKVSYDIAPGGLYHIKLNSADWSTFQVNLGATGGGAYSLKLTPEQFEQFKTAGFFNGLKLQATVEPSGEYVINMTPEEYKIFQENQNKQPAAPEVAAPDDSSISVTQDPSGNYVLVLTAGQYGMVKSSFAGINVKPTTDKSGNMTFRLNESQWQQFQANQAKAAAGQAASAAPEASEASEVVLNIDTASFEALKGMGAFDGVKYSSSTEGSTVSVRLSQQEFEKFQAKQGAGVSIGKPDELSADGGMDVGKVKIPDFDKDTEKKQREVGKLNVEGFSESKPEPKEQRQVGKLGDVNFNKKKDEAPKTVKKVGKLSNPFEKQGQSAGSAPAKRGPGKITSRFGNKFGGSGLQNDGGSEMLKSSMTESRRAVRGPSRRAPSSNPVKNLEARKDVSKDYRAASEMKEMTDDFIKDYLGPGLSKAADLDRIASPRPSPTPATGKKNSLTNNKGFANEAVDALRATEDYTKIKLNKGHTQKAVKEVAGGKEQLQETLLVQIKGKQSMQTRLVAPNFSSLNSYESFLLITPTTLFQFNGKHASVLKKSKGTELVTAITMAKEFKCAADKATVLEQVRGSYLLRQFNKHLQINNENEQVSEKHIDDEVYEKEQNSANVGYVLDEEGQRFTMVPELSGKRLKQSRLKDSNIYCFDYGAEVYVWIGRAADKGSRKNAMIAGRQIWDSKQRPSWGIFQRIAGGLEHSLFREKFKDWPDVNAKNVLTVKNPCAPIKDKITFVDMEPCDAEQMRTPLPENPPGLVLEMTDVGRGLGLPTDLSQDIFGHDVETTSVEMWRITDSSYEEYPQELYGQFYSNESFIIRWAYRVMQGGKKQDHDTGRDRAAFFFWQGADCTIKEKGKSAFLTVKVDSERAPQVQLDQSTEPPAFLQIFNGSMVTYKGKISDDRSGKRRRLFLYRGETEKEGSLTELDEISCTSLRSRSSFIIQDGESLYYVWHGCKSRAHTVGGAFQAANTLADRSQGERPAVVEVQEGSESKEFWKCFVGGKIGYFNLLDDERKYAKSLRLFNLYEDKKQLMYKELEYSGRYPKVAAPYPFLQSDLYSAEQPALFILDALYTVYVWVGWWPSHTPDGEVLAHTGSAETDFVERYKLTLQTALAYSELDTKEKPDMVVVNAGAEPTEFKCLFPWWKDREDVPAGKPGPTPLDEELKKFLQTEFTLQELQAKPPPIGCDPLRLEQYLSNTEFKAIFNMTKKEFLNLQAWKQIKLKQKHDLF